MDKNTIIGFVMIAAILIGFSVLTRPSEEELAKQKAYNDSIALVQQKQYEQAQALMSQQQPSDSTITVQADSTDDLAAKMGEFGDAATGLDTAYVLENKNVQIQVSSKGGCVSQVILKRYESSDSLPLILFNKEESSYGFTFVTNKNRIIKTRDLYFQTPGVLTDKDGNQSLSLKLPGEDGSWIVFDYSLPADGYLLDYNISSVNLQKILPLGTNSLEMNWISQIRQQENGRKFEERYSNIQYKFTAGDVENLSESKDDSKNLSTNLQWVAFKDQFFSAVIIAENNAFTSTQLESKVYPEGSPYIKQYKAGMSVGFDVTGKSQTNLSFYYGPNKYSVLSALDKGKEAKDKLNLTKLIPLGWGIFGWVNKYAIIPMFNFFSSFIGSFGIIILLMTVVIKLVLFPLTYKSYISSAKMRVLKPEIDEINARIPADKAAERQKATMELYNKVGVSPFSGCLPTLLQMPILFAMFSFFPASIELRHQSFLWAQDLSSYDAIVSWNTYIPLITNNFGNHISLFTLLMTVASLVSTKLNMANTATPDQPGAGMMKWMMYLMPIMFMFMFNSYAAGLSYYYFVSTMITIIQTYAIRATVDEKKLLAQLHAKKAKNAKNPPKKKSGFMERLEKMQRDQQKMMQDKNKNKK